MADTTRRSVLTTVVAAGTVAIAGCSSDSDRTGGSSIVTNVDVVEKEEPYTRLVLAVDLVEDHGIDELALQDSEGSVVTDGGVDPAQTRVELSLAQANLGPDTYEVIGYDDETVVERANWTPDTNVTVESVRTTGPSNDDLLVRITNKGDITLSATDATLIGGYPVEDDTAGVKATDSPTEIGVGQTRGISISTDGMEGGLLAPSTDSCEDQQEEITAQITFAERDDLTIQSVLTFSGVYKDRYTSSGCTNVTVSNVREL
jgi:hypothetical protein